jgi:hypothetical protein
VKNPGLDERIILKLIFERLDGGTLVKIDLAEGRDRWWTLVYTVMNPRVP